MHAIYRVCGDRTKNYAVSAFGFGGELPDFDLKMRMRKVVEDDLKYVFDPAFPSTPSRYSDGSWRVLYTAKEYETAIYEVGHHYREKCRRMSGLKQYRVAYKMVYKVHAHFKKQIKVPEEDKFKHTSDYAPCQDFAKQSIAAGCCSLEAPSVRRDLGVNFPIFDQSVVSSDPSLEARFTLRWLSDTDKVVHFAEGVAKELSFAV